MILRHKDEGKEKLPRTESSGPATIKTKALDPRSQQFDEIVASAKELFLQKNKQYGDAIAETGVLGAVVSIVGLNARLKKIVLASSDAGKSQEEALKDILKDTLNYAAIAGMMIMDDNWRPE